MHLLQSAPPSAPLRPYVRAYAQRDVRSHGPGLVQPVPASLEHILEFEFVDPPLIEYAGGRTISAFGASVVGLHTRPGIHLRLYGHIQSFAIFFEPFGIWQLFRIPNRELTDSFYDARELLGMAVHDLWHALGECTSFSQRVAAVETFLTQRAVRSSGRTPIMKAAAHLFQRRGTLRIQDLAADTGLGIRQFERRFAESTGMSPKLFGRITRFQMALDGKLSKPDRTWLSIAHEFGYHDQMHMIRDFHGLGGASPQAILADLGDTRPPALANSNSS